MGAPDERAPGLLNSRTALAPAVALVDAPDRPPTLAERREAAQKRLAGLKAAAADEPLRGAEPDASAIPAAKAAVAVLAEAEQIAHDRARQAEAEAAMRRLAELRALVELHQRDRLAAIGEAQQAFEAGAAAMRRAGQALDAIKGAAVAIGYPTPLALLPSETALRLSRRVASSLARLRSGHPTDFGTISWTSTAWAFGLDPSWSTAEGIATAAAIEELTKGEPRDDQ